MEHKETAKSIDSLATLVAQTFIETLSLRDLKFLFDLS